MNFSTKIPLIKESKVYQNQYGNDSRPPNVGTFHLRSKLLTLKLYVFHYTNFDFCGQQFSGNNL